MQSGVLNIFKKHGIEFAEAIDYSAMKEVNSRLALSLDFTPRTAIIFLVPYYVGEGKNISSYSTSRDYHAYISELSLHICAELKALYPEYTFRGFGDHSPIDERYAALISSLGILGKNGLLINEKYGSYVFIGDVITDLPPDILDAAPKTEIKACEGCGACLRACATGILCGRGSDCLSAITQKRGTLTDDEVELMRKHNTVWGCDICQTACPYNKTPRRNQVPSG